jgi:hypothetical protein
LTPSRSCPGPLSVAASDILGLTTQKSESSSCLMLRQSKFGAITVRGDDLEDLQFVGAKRGNHTLFHYIQSSKSCVDHSSMSKTLRASFLNITPIPRRRHLPDPPTVPRHHKQAHVPHKANTSQDAVNSQITARRQPRRDTEIDRKRQRVPDQHASRNHLARKFRIA